VITHRYKSVNEARNLTVLVVIAQISIQKLLFAEVGLHGMSSTSESPRDAKCSIDESTDRKTFVTNLKVKDVVEIPFALAR
jgi:hypothetical protein